MIREHSYSFYDDNHKNTYVKPIIVKTGREKRNEKRKQLNKIKTPRY